MTIATSKLDLNFEIDPAPDIVVEVDIYHDSTDNHPIYAALGVSEIWRYDGLEATILHLQGNDYVEAGASKALSMITYPILTEYLTRMRLEGEIAAIKAFDEWLQSLQQ
ncbi:MAG: Uma2 family endonuclease [Blastocatellia bacterium]